MGIHEPEAVGARGYGRWKLRGGRFDDTAESALKRSGAKSISAIYAAEGAASIEAAAAAECVCGLLIKQI